LVAGSQKRFIPGRARSLAIIVLAKRAFYFARGAELAPNQLHGSDEALGTAAFHAFINVMHKARLIRFGAGKSHGFITLLANGLFGERGGLGHFFKAPIILKILANLQMSESTTAKPDHSRKSNGALEIFPGDLPGGRSFQVNFSRMWGSRGIGNHAQHTLQGDEAGEDEGGYSNDSKGVIDVAHDGRYLLSSQAHASADRDSREAAGCWAFSETAHKARAAVDAFPQRPTAPARPPRGGK
jgi:hypothetical protein